MNTLGNRESREVAEKLSLDEQRNLLLELNPDIIYGVYDLKSSTQDNIDLELVEDIMTIYPNQLSNIKGLEKTPDIILCDLGALRKGEFKIIAGNERPDYTRNGFNEKGDYKTELDDGHTMRVSRNLVLLSNGVLEYIEGSTGKKHLIATLRDGGSFDSLQRTTTAGRNVGYNLSEEVEREHYEEGPFLGKNDNGEYTLCIPAGNIKIDETTPYIYELNYYLRLEKGFEGDLRSLTYLKKSIDFWLKNKYNLSRDNEEDIAFIEAFERNFPGIKYEELGEILKDIVENNRFMTYEWSKGDIEGIGNDMKKVSINNIGKENEIEAFVYHDKENNTIEYIDVRRIHGIPKGFHLLGNRPCKLFLESQNQYSRVPRIENAFKDKSVPTIDYVSRKVDEAIRNKKPTHVQEDTKSSLHLSQNNVKALSVFSLIFFIAEEIELSSVDRIAIETFLNAHYDRIAIEKYYRKGNDLFLKGAFVCDKFDSGSHEYLTSIVIKDVF